MWMVGNKSEYWYTSNGGASWSAPGFETGLSAYDFRDVHFYGSSFGCVAGQSSSDGIIRYTTNGGSTWHTFYSLHRLIAIQTISSTRAVAVGHLGTIYVFDISAGVGSEVLSPISSGTTNILYDVHFFDSNNGWAVGENSTVLKTTNGGYSWTNINFPALNGGYSSITLTSVHFWDSSHGVLVGGGGERWITKDGGASWIDTYDAGGTFYYGGTLTSASSGFAVGESGTNVRYAVPDIDVTNGAIPVPDGGFPSVGITAPGTPLAKTFTIHNSGAATLSIYSLGVISGDTSDFSVGTPSSFSIGAGGSATFQVVFTPTVLGFRSALVNLSNNVSGSKQSYTFELQGNGIGTPQLSVSPLRKFKSIVGKNSRPQRIYIRNVGNDFLEDLSLSKSGRGKRDFKFIGHPGPRLAPSGATSLIVKYKPRKAGRSKAFLTVRSSNGGTKLIAVKGVAKSRR